MVQLEAYGLSIQRKLNYTEANNQQTKLAAGLTPHAKKFCRTSKETLAMRTCKEQYILNLGYQKRITRKRGLVNHY